MEISQIIDFLEAPGTRWGSRSHERVINNFDIQPYEFLRFAEQDLAAEYDHKLINALSNAKRALDSQVDTLLIGFDFYQQAKNKTWSFPKKLEIIQKLGILAPRVLRKINTTRNLMEHDFVKPQIDKVEDFVDITSLFLASTDKYIMNLPGECEFENDDHKDYWLRMNLDIEAPKLSVMVVSKVAENFEIDFNSNHPDYLTLLKGYLRIGNAY
ncbi:hypothetical protein [Chitinophaga caseinilytica]|uniref:HEPN AbiU2-like domain-containing protein n=1 Tax=Chitinophaga caseinilytica TaxID=2267521 RepID=A0ABZ2Z1X4_9BACT